MHLPESLQDLVSSKPVRFLRRPKSITRILTGTGQEGAEKLDLGTRPAAPSPRISSVLGPTEASAWPSQVFALVVFSSLLTDGYQNTTDSPQLHCVFNSNHMACSFAVGIGLFAFLTCLVFLALDARETRMANTHLKMVFRLLDIILAVLWAVIWFIGFCFLANQWHRSPPKKFLAGLASAKAAITFAFFSIFISIFQAYLAFQELQSDVPVPYKRSLDETGVVLTTLSPPLNSNAMSVPNPAPISLTYSSSTLSSYMTTSKAPCLAMMPDS